MKLKKLVAGLLSGAMMLGFVGMVPEQPEVTAPITAQAAASDFTADQAIDWVKSKEGTTLDPDGAYGGQCVDLIDAYMDYMGINWRSYLVGGAKEFSWRSCPDGWTRIEGATPQKGDVLVYTDGDYGHVAIFESDSTTWHQNFDGKQYVVQVPSSYWYWNRAGYWGVLRPNFKDPLPPTPTPDTSIENGKYNIVNVGTGQYLNHGYGWVGEARFYPAIVDVQDGTPEQTFNVENAGGTSYIVRSGYNATIMNVWAKDPSAIWLNQYITFFDSDDGNNTQRFCFAPVGNGEYVIENAENQKLVLGIQAETFKNTYNMVKTQSYNESDANQRWKFVRLDAPATETTPVETTTTIAETTTVIVETTTTAEETTTAVMESTTTEEVIPGTRPVETTTAPAAPDRFYCDANDDGTVDIMDVIVLNKYLLGAGNLTNTGRKNADTNRDGYLDTTDSLNIIKCVVEILAQGDFPIQ